MLSSTGAISDTDIANFSDGSLKATISTNSRANDVLAIKHHG